MELNQSLHLNKEWLYQKYVVEELSTYKIAKIVHRNPKNVYCKLVDFGISTRKRGENLKGKDNYMKIPGIENPFKGKTHSIETKNKLSISGSRPKPYLRGKNNGMYNRMGKLNPNYKDGSSPERQQLYSNCQYKNIIKQCYLRDNYKCKRCGTTHKGKIKLHAHHIIAWSDSKEKRFELDNLITLCKKCHEFVHSKKNKKREFLNENLQH